MVWTGVDLKFGSPPVPANTSIAAPTDQSDRTSSDLVRSISPLAPSDQIATKEWKHFRPAWPACGVCKESSTTVTVVIAGPTFYRTLPCMTCILPVSWHAPAAGHWGFPWRSTLQIAFQRAQAVILLTLDRLQFHGAVLSNNNCCFYSKILVYQQWKPAVVVHGQNDVMNQDKMNVKLVAL